VTSAQEFFDHGFSADLRARVRQLLPLRVAVAFEVTGELGGVWVVRNDAAGVRVSREATKRVDCRLRCSDEELMAIIEGRNDARRSFFQGRLEVEGDIALALKIQQAVIARAA
jgi:predicted lipid carrier protein YhbT